MCACSLTCGCCLVRNKTKKKHENNGRLFYREKLNTLKCAWHRTHSHVQRLPHTSRLSCRTSYRRDLQIERSEACECVRREKLNSGKSKQKRQTHTCSHFCRLHDMRWDETQTCACSAHNSCRFVRYWDVIKRNSGAQSPPNEYYCTWATKKTIAFKQFMSRASRRWCIVTFFLWKHTWLSPLFTLV